MTYRKRYRQRAGAIKHVKAALAKRASESGHRIAKHIIHRKLGETFLIPSLRPTYATNEELIKEEIRRVAREVRKNPRKTLKTAYRLLRTK